MTDLRTFGRDYGRHALATPGGDNRQRDVLHILGPLQVRAFHPTRLNPDYVGAHRVPWWDMQIDYPLTLTEWTDA
jgi:hypothetical protein